MIKNLLPLDVAQMMAEGRCVLVDVRENAEYEEECIDGSTLMPLSSFKPALLRVPEGQKVVFHCAAGVRSARAVEACLAQGMPYDSHIVGGLAAWKKLGLPTKAR